MPFYIALLGHQRKQMKVDVQYLHTCYIDEPNKSGHQSREEARRVTQDSGAVAAQLTSVRHVVATCAAFCALRHDGSLATRRGRATQRENEVVFQCMVMVS